MDVVRLKPTPGQFFELITFNEDETRESHTFVCCHGYPARFWLIM